MLHSDKITVDQARLTKLYLSWLYDVSMHNRCITIDIKDALADNARSQPSKIFVSAWR